LVTGAATGIGRATALELAKRGYLVAVNHLEQGPQAAAVADLIGGEAFAVDVADADAVVAMVDAIEDRLGPLEVAVCCAGVDCEVRIEDTTDEMWDRMLRVLLGGSANVLAAVSPYMQTRGVGSIVTIASELALCGDAWHVSYVSAKAAILGLTRAMAHELAPAGIRVNSVAPGPTDTELLGDRWRGSDYLGTVPLGRIGRPSEVATSIVDLAEATWTTGQVLSPNGGTVIQ
jgi:3-oxoacyl-[acyl-carrier protein] reductase